MARKPTSDEFYSDREVLAALSNAVIAYTRWDRIQGFSEKSSKLLKFVEAYLEDALDIATLRQGSGNDTVITRLLTDEEMGLCFVLGATLLMYRKTLPENSSLHDMFIGKLLKENV